MKVIKKQTKPVKTKYPLRITCEHCGAELEIEQTDVSYREWGFPFVACPECHGCTTFDGDCKPITPDNLEYPAHFMSSANAVKVSDDSVQDMVRTAYRALWYSGEKYDYYTIETGNTVVFGYKNDDGIRIYVSKDTDDFFLSSDSVPADDPHF